jgi:hypothetical protein
MTPVHLTAPASIQLVHRARRNLAAPADAA